MQNTALWNLLAPYAILGGRNALMPLYKSIEITPSGFRGVSSFGLLERDAITGINVSLFVDSTALLSVAKSLPASEVLLHNDNGVLHWTCGSAKGRLASMQVDSSPPSIDVSKVIEGSYGEVETTNEWRTAFDLGALSCDPAALGTIGMYGVTMDNQGSMNICATDNITISSCDLGFHVENAPATTTIPPAAADLLANIVQAGGQLFIGKDECLYVSADMETRCLIKQIPSMKMNIRSIIESHNQANSTLTLPQDRVKAFIARATALAENRRDTRVTLSVLDGALSLAFDEGASASEEYFMTDELAGFPDMPPVGIAAVKVARALSYTNTMALDYIDDGKIIFIGGSFRYMVGGQPRK